MTSRAAPPHRPTTAVLRGVGLVLLLAILVPVLGCGAAGAAPEPARPDVVACEYDHGHHGVRPAQVALIAAARPVAGDPDPPHVRPEAPVGAAPGPPPVAPTDRGPAPPPGGLLLSIGVARR